MLMDVASSPTVIRFSFTTFTSTRASVLRKTVPLSWLICLVTRFSSISDLTYPSAYNFYIHQAFRTYLRHICVNIDGTATGHVQIFDDNTLLLREKRHFHYFKRVPLGELVQ
jgi:hypothetical protein